VFTVPGPAAAAGVEASIRWRYARAASAGPRLRADRAVALALQNLDDRLGLELDGEVVAELDVEPWTGAGATLALELDGGGARFEELRVWRDIYYVSQGVHTSETEIPPGYYLMLGDNTQDSADGRDWRMVSYEWAGDDGFSVNVEGNYRPNESPKDVPASGERGRLVFFKDVWGEPHFLDANRARPAAPVPAPLVPRHLIRGRGFAVFWPIRPWDGISRLAWIH
jgi:hypothetical protein